MTSGSWTKGVEKWGCWWRVWDEPQDDHITNQCPHSVESTSLKGEVEIWPRKSPQKHGPSMLPDSRVTVKRWLMMRIEIRKSGRCRCWGEWHLVSEELCDVSYIPVGKRTFPHQRGDSGLFLLSVTRISSALMQHFYFWDLTLRKWAEVPRGYACTSPIVCPVEIDAERPPVEEWFALFLSWNWTFLKH